MWNIMLADSELFICLFELFVWTNSLQRNSHLLSLWYHRKHIVSILKVHLNRQQKLEDNTKDSLYNIYLINYILQQLNNNCNEIT